MAVRVPPAMSPGLSASIAEVAAMSDSAFRKRFRSSYESSPSSSPLDLPLRKRYRGTSKDEGLIAGDEGPGMRVESLSLGRDEAVLEGRQRATLVMETAVGHSSGFVPDPERPERVSALRQPTLTTWIDPEDGIAYIDVLAYPPPTPPAQTPSSLEWSSSSLPVSPTPSIVPLPISSPMIPVTIPSPVASLVTTKIEGSLTELGTRVEIHGGLIRDHTVRLEELSPALFERYDRDIGELFTRPVLALESWAGQTDTQRAALWHVISDMLMENRELRLQITKERRVRLDLAEIVDSMRRGT
ncbi:hypothetical protein Tco_1072854 [Tanacetum coccineum]